jgi:hypothetical protein
VGGGYGVGEIGMVWGDGNGSGGMGMRMRMGLGLGRWG